MHVMRELISPRAAADILGVHTATLVRWLEAGLIEGIKLPGGQHRYYADSINTVIATPAGDNVIVISKRGGDAA